MKGLEGRINEINLIKNMIESKESKLGAVYGRRRIGKSFLIESVSKNYKSYLFEGVENQTVKEQFDHFLFQLKYYFKKKVKITEIKNWKEGFILLYELIKKEKDVVIVFDEFQWMSNYRGKIASELKFAWDKFYSKLPNTNIILCGSIASFMINKVIKSKALYGRIDLEINLKAFDIKETKLILKNRSNVELVEGFLFTGGVPKYLTLLKGAKSIRLGIQELAFTQNGYFNQEYKKIFISHFGKNIEYEKIIKILMKHPDGLFRKVIAEKLKVKSGGHLSELLFNLEEAGFIMKYIPYDKGLNCRYKKYFVSDAYIRFYFAFILPYEKQIKMQTAKNLFIEISQSHKYIAWLGKNFELFCFLHANLIAEKLGISGINYSYGPYFKTRNDKNGFQIDLLFDRQDNVISLCEIKYTNKKIGVDIIEEVEQKVELLDEKRKTIQRVLITKSEPTQELIDKCYFYNIITLDDLLA